MDKLKKILLHEYVLVFLFCLAAIHGPAFSLMDNYDQTTCVDCQTYMGVARGDFDQSPVRRYRPVVPALAAGVHLLFGKAFNALRPQTFPGDFPLGMSFYLVNCLLMSLAGVMVYRYSRSFGLRPVWALGGLLVMLTCRWTPYLAGVPIVDSLYFLVLTAMLVGIQEKNEGIIAATILIGPFSKEAFLFVAPVIFIFSHVSRWRQIIYFAISGILVFSFRYAYDHYLHVAPTAGIEADVEILGYMGETIRRLFSFHGMYDVFSNVSLWVILIVAALRLPSYRQEGKEALRWHMLGYFLAVGVHLIINANQERMFYLMMPMLCLFTGLAFRELAAHYFGTEK